MSDSDTMRVAEVEPILGVHNETVRHLIWDRRLKAKMIDREYFIRVDELVRFMRRIGCPLHRLKPRYCGKPHTISECAEVLDVHENTARIWFDSGHLPGWRVGVRRLIDPFSLHAVQAGISQVAALKVSSVRKQRSFHQ